MRVLIVALAILIAASVSIRFGRTITIADARGAPVAGAYVAYHDEGTTYAVVEALTYLASGQTVAKSDAAGRVAIPWAVHSHLPLVQSAPQLNVDLIYAPSLHNGLAWVSRLGAVSRPGEFQVSDDRRDIRLEDLSGDPEKWQGTLMNLGSLLGRLTSRPTSDDRTSALTQELIDRFRSEYAAILDRYGDVPRTPPVMPAAVVNDTDREKQAWHAMVEKDLAARPLWGDELRRRFATEVDVYNRRAR
jgi:hypothetical protein